MFNNKKIKQLETKIKVLDNHVEILWKKTQKLNNETETKLLELEKTIKNQPLIKKYQKTLDIFLKNSKN